VVTGDKYVYLKILCTFSWNEEVNDCKDAWSGKLQNNPSPLPQLIPLRSQRRSFGRFREKVISYFYRNSNPGPSKL